MMNKLLKCALYRLRVRFFSGKPGSLFEELFRKHKICTFHVYIVP